MVAPPPGGATVAFARVSRSLTGRLGFGKGSSGGPELVATTLTRAWSWSWAPAAACGTLRC